MSVIKITIDVITRRAAAIRDPITPLESKRRPQVFRTSEVENSQNDEVRLEARIQAAEKVQKMKRLKKRLIRIEKNQSDEASTNSSQILKQKQMFDAILSFYNDMNSRFISFALKYSIINVKHFKNIVNNKFEAKHICKFITKFFMMKISKKYLKMRNVNLQIRNYDVHFIDIKSIMHLMQCFLIYIQIFLHFINSITKNNFNQKFMFYVDRLIKHTHVRT